LITTVQNFVLVSKVFKAYGPMEHSNASLVQYLLPLGVSPLQLFVIGAALNDIDICYTALLRDTQWSSKDRNGVSHLDRLFADEYRFRINRSFHERNQDASIFDLGALPYELMALIPHQYLWALLRAQKESFPEIEYDSLAVRFLTLIRPMRRRWRRE